MAAKRPVVARPTRSAMRSRSRPDATSVGCVLGVWKPYISIERRRWVASMRPNVRARAASAAAMPTSTRPKIRVMVILSASSDLEVDDLLDHQRARDHEQRADGQ